MASVIKIGFITGTGLADPKLLQNKKEKCVTTPFGEPSDALILGTINGVECVLLSRHNRKTIVMSSEVNYRANLYALKEEGCTHVIVTTACGSLQEHIHPGSLVVIDQFIDRTQGRHTTFYDGTCSKFKGICHIPMSEPFCQQTRRILMETTKDLGLTCHDGGTMVTINGPRFSSKAESKMYRLWGADVVNMTTVPEVFLAKELGLCYSTLAVVTDYDCWRNDKQPIEVDLVFKILRETTDKVLQVLVALIPKVQAEDWTDTIKEHQDMVKRSILLPSERF